MFQSGSASGAPDGARGSWADRRAHPRIPSAKLGITRVNIRSRSSASLVDLSSGGALLELPFQLPPESRVAMELDTGGEKHEVPLQLLRCYVADLTGGVKYHAAGAFDNLLNLEALALRASTAMHRLTMALERLERSLRQTATHSRSDAQFYETVTDLTLWLRRGESLDLAVLKLKARLTQTYRSLLIIPSALATMDRTSSLQCFGLTFEAKHPLPAHDRRFLKANAQLISILEDTRRELLDEDLRPRFPQVAQTGQSRAAQPEPAARAKPPWRTPIAGPVAKEPATSAGVTREDRDCLSALMLDPAFA
jgi:PilZ domain